MLYRVFLLFLFLNSFLFSFELSKFIETQQLTNPIEILYDKEEQYTIQNLPKKDFVKTENLALGYVKGAVWSKLELQTPNNTTISPILLINPKININIFDVYVFEENNLLSIHTLGNYRQTSQNHIDSKFSNLLLTVKPNTRYTIIAKLKSKSVIDVNWIVSNENKFLSFIIYDILFWGIFLGFVSSLILYNLSLFMSLKEYSYLIYAFHGLTALLFQFATNGLFYQFGLYDKPLIFNSVSWILAQFSLLSILAFGMLFLNTKKTMPKIHTVLIGLAFVVLSMIMLFLYSFFNIEIITLVRTITKPLSLIVVFFVLIVAFWGVKQNIEGAKYYLIGHGIFLVTIFYQQLGGIINNTTTFLTIYIVAIGILFDVVFLSLALGKKLQTLKYEKEKNEKLLISQSSFSAIGRTIGNLSHQWKIPVARLGTLITQMEATLWKKDDKIKYELEPIIDGMRSSLDFMQHSINEFNNFYTHSSHKITFNLSSEIDNILNLLSAKILYTNCTVNKELDEDIKLFGYKSAFANICLIIIDNALDILKQRDIQKAHITIRLYKENHLAKLIITDNGGGITITPIEKIFDVFVSEKTDGNGMGLAMANILLKERLGGQISVYNQDDGAIFELIIPLI